MYADYYHILIRHVYLKNKSPSIKASINAKLYIYRTVILSQLRVLQQQKKCLHSFLAL